ncbi:hypothetical protein LTR09_011416 [Extremus antarcticus]|uniref:Uncharacterized protein n=1 Tax=Extremus antarcticus TaxID=702011 RepID=A0AAJ0G4H2_9PEZI|nr:hypothetical protein LTR09_011416 [Extremus antarcticus]
MKLETAPHAIAALLVRGNALQEYDIPYHPNENYVEAVPGSNFAVYLQFDTRQLQEDPLADYYISETSFSDTSFGEISFGFCNTTTNTRMRGSELWEATMQRPG